MKTTIAELKKQFSYLDYSTLVQSYGYEIIGRIKLGSYSGDIVMVVCKDKEYGLLVTGYGSCSGCDALYSCGESINKLEDLREKLCSGVIFYSALNFIEHLDKKDWRLEYFGGECESLEFNNFLEKAKEQILIIGLAKI